MNFYMSWARSSRLCCGFWQNSPSPERPSPLCARLPRSPSSAEAAPCGCHQATACPPPIRHTSKRRLVCFASAEEQPLTQRWAARHETEEPSRCPAARWPQGLQGQLQGQSVSLEVYRWDTGESIWKSFPGKPGWSSQLFPWVYTSSFRGLRSGSWRCPAWAPIDYEEARKCCCKRDFLVGRNKWEKIPWSFLQSGLPQSWRLLFLLPRSASQCSLKPPRDEIVKL